MTTAAQVARGTAPRGRSMTDRRTDVEFFSTAGLADRERVERWEEHNERALIGLSCRALDERPLEARELNVSLPELRLAEVAAGAHLVERTRREIERAAMEGVALYFSLHGEAFFYHENGVLLQQPGTLLVADVSMPFMRGFARGLEEYVLTVPRAVFEAVTERAMPASPITMSFGDAPGGDAAAAELARLVQRTLVDPDPQAYAATEESALELLRAMFSSDGAHSAASYRRAAIAVIERQLRDPGLSVARVAAAVGVSERHLARAFSEAGTGVARTILERRLDLAHRLLTSRGTAPVAEIAAYCGFASPAHFARVFRERFELSPAEVRSRG
ncbi:helix-turn-helix domain-containing protein [Gryllotalpicola koreensis]|uniref:Helix-turn-helix domain-containing protein n=1 Tax=Gryllotalpicola koreensis TaxID=993086 RepID=A0ABP8ADE0_9MICO